MCVCGVAENPATKTFFCCSRGVWHSHPTTRNEAVGESGKQGLISLVYLHRLSDSESLFGPLVAALFVLLVLSGNVFASRGKPRASRAKPSRDSSVVLETHQLYSRLISCTRKISALHLEFKCVHPIRGESSGVPIV